MSTITNPVAWTEIYVEDLQRAKKFYETVLNITLATMSMPEGMTADPGSDDYFEMLFFPANPDAAGSGAALVKSPMFKAGSGGTLVYFACEDCSVEISRVEAAGGTVVSPKMPIGEYGFCGICTDTGGNTIGFHSMS